MVNAIYFLGNMGVYASSNQAVVNRILKDPMFLNYVIAFNRNQTDMMYQSFAYDQYPWVAVDLGTVRQVDAIQISQAINSALNGNL